MNPTAARFVAFLALFALAAPAAVRADGSAPPAVSDSTSTIPERFDTDRPDVTDGSTRVEPGVVQIETGWSRMSQDGSSVSSFGDALVRIGLLRAFELRIFTPGRERFSFGAEGSSTEWGEAGLGFKLGRTSTDGERGIAVVASMATPVQSRGARLTETEALLAGDWAIGRLGASANVGIHRVSQGGTSSGSLLTSVSLSNEVSRRVGAFLEIAAEFQDDGELEWTRFLDAGASWAVMPHLQVDASAGRFLAVDGPWMIGAGLSKRW